MRLGPFELYRLAAIWSLTPYIHMAREETNAGSEATCNPDRDLALRKEVTLCSPPCRYPWRGLHDVSKEMENIADMMEMSI